jgi:hypothetical protein
VPAAATERNSSRTKIVISLAQAASSPRAQNSSFEEPASPTPAASAMLKAGPLGLLPSKLALESPLAADVSADLSDGVSDDEPAPPPDGDKSADIDVRYVRLCGQIEPYADVRASSGVF